MKLCINCHTLNADDAVFCSECGMSLINVPTGEDALKLREAWEGDHPEEAAAFEGKRREQAHRPPLQPLTASGIVYVFGHFLPRPGTPPKRLFTLGVPPWR